MDHRFERLIKRYKDHAATPEEQQELFELIQSDAYDKDLLEDINDTLQSTRPGPVHMKDEIREETFERIAREQSIEQPAKRIPMVRWFAIAASLALIAVAGLWLFYGQPGFPRVKHYTGKGTFVLPDGTQVSLNADSDLSYFTEGNSRIVQLSGEAFFDVIHNPTHPFIVQTGKIRTRVLGTAFSVRAYPVQKEVQVTVERGLVEVGEESHAYAKVKPDEQITVDKRTAKFHTAEVDAHAETAWKEEGALVIDDMMLQDAVMMIEQRYQYTLVFTNPELRTCRMSGSFTSHDDLTKIVSVICGMAGAEYSIDESKRQVTVTGGSCQ